MATSSERSTKRVALCSALAAGFAYVGYSIMKNAFCKRNSSNGERHKLHSKINQGIQTDLTLSCSAKTLALLPEWYTENKSVKERVKLLNIYAQQHEGLPFGPNFKPRSLQNTPWSSPRIIGPKYSRKFISYSAENISSVSPDGSPVKKPKLPEQNLANEGLSEDEVTTDVDSTKISAEESESVLLKRLDNLFNRARVVTPYEARSLVSLLAKKDDDILVKTLSTISNCSAFTVNQSYFYDADCPKYLRELLTHPAVTVQIAATQALSNLAVNDEGETVFQSCIPILLHHATAKELELLQTVSLMALANLALHTSNQSLIGGSIQEILDLLENGSNGIQLQTLKLLVNLSCNTAIVPSILAAKAPSKLYSYLDEKNDFDICLRLVTFLANIMTVASELNLQISDLPLEHKAPCPETLFVVIFGYFGRELLLKKIKLLMSSQDEDIVRQTSRINDIITKLS